MQNTSKPTTTACFIQGESSGGRQVVYHLKIPLG